MLARLLVADACKGQSARVKAGIGSEAQAACWRLGSYRLQGGKLLYKRTDN